MDHLRARRCSRSASSACCCSTCCNGCRTPAVEPDRHGNVHAFLAFNTAVSFLTNTNWQNYAGETTHEPPHPDGRASRCRTSCRPRSGSRSMVALIRGLTRRRAAHDRQLLGRPHPHRSPRILLPIAFVFAIVLVRQGVIQNFHGFTDVHTVAGHDAADPGRAGGQPGVDQGARHERRRLLQRELGPPVREPDRAQQLPRDLLLLLIPFALAFTFGRMVEGQAPGLRGASRSMAVALARAPPSAPCSSRPTATRSSTRQGSPRPSPASSTRRQPGGQGDAGSARPASALLCAVDHRHVERLGELDARQLHTARRHGAAGQHEARRGEPRWCRRRPLRPAGLGAPRRCSSPASWSGEHRSTWARRSRRPR